MAIVETLTFGQLLLLVIWIVCGAIGVAAAARRYNDAIEAALLVAIIATLVYIFRFSLFG